MILFKPKELYANKMLANTPYLMKIYEMCKDGRLKAINKGSDLRAIYYVPQESVLEYNSKPENQVKVIGRPKHAVSEL